MVWNGEVRECDFPHPNVYLGCAVDDLNRKEASRLCFLMEPGENCGNRYGKRIRNASKIPVVKFTKAKEEPASSVLSSFHSHESEDSGKFGVSFDDSVVVNAFSQANDGSQVREQPKHSRAQKFLSVLSPPQNRWK
ncbi:unnamed protein product [Litomosoides sigmodontis]|uniref:Uncharacterized protein n=1 Tax=Litomosoides sigmodontis TaxID=42156 RepID=A0A3P6T1X1_LITSI|nr:unnamed protein product [Litomosoides sigmodontis]